MRFLAIDGPAEGAATAARFAAAEADAKRGGELAERALQLRRLVAERDLLLYCPY